MASVIVERSPRCPKAAELPMSQSLRVKNVEVGIPGCATFSLQKKLSAASHRLWRFKSVYARTMAPPSGVGSRRGNSPFLVMSKPTGFETANGIFHSGLNGFASVNTGRWSFMAGTWQVAQPVELNSL